MVEIENSESFLTEIVAQAAKKEGSAIKLINKLRISHTLLKKFEMHAHLSLDKFVHICKELKIKINLDNG